MNEFRNKLQKAYKKNEEFECDQVIENGPTPDNILMIDKKTWKKISPKMKIMYEFSYYWKEAFHGADLLCVRDLEKLYDKEYINKSIRLIAENYKPLPPSDPSDWDRTALMAAEDGGVGIAYGFYWWKNSESIEPCVVYINGGTADIFFDLDEFLDFLVDGTFPEKGNEIYGELENQRGTLSGL